MRLATLSEVRSHAKAWFDIVESGESVRVLRNGKPIADIVPVAASLPSWKRRKAEPLELEGAIASQMIVEDRDHELAPRNSAKPRPAVQGGESDTGRDGAST